ncbi:MAG TPA: S9 family peptidase [bacterium]|nr:S9 family peptidase [bacterium]
MSQVRRYSLMISVFLLFGYALTAQSKRPITADDLWAFKRLSGFTVSPDNKYGCFVVTDYNVKENKGNSDLYLIELATGKTKRLTTNVGSDNSPAWHPNSRTIAFISKREGDYAQLHQIDIDGGEASLITEMPMGAAAPKYFPDGKRIAFVSTILPAYENDFDVMKKNLKERKDSKMSAKVSENRFFRYWDTWLTDGYVPHLYSFHIETKERKDLTPGLNELVSSDGSLDYDISPDGQWITFTRNSSNPPYAQLNSDVFLFKAGEYASAVNITADNLDDDGGAVFSKDGKSLWYSRSFEKNHPDLSHVVRYDLTSKEHKVITDKMDRSFGSYTESDNKKDWYFVAEDMGRTSVYNYNTQNQKIEKIFTEGSMANVNVGTDKLWFLRTSISSPAEIWEYNFKTKKAASVTSFNKSLLDSLDFGKTESLTFKGADNDDVQMYVVYPPNFDPNKKYPLVHMIHGGPHGAFGDDWSYRWNAHAFAAPGYVVALINFHGSTGFGKSFMTSIVGAHADKPFTDIMRGTDYLLQKYNFLDSTRMAASGGSYGGYLVNWIAGHTNRFKCLISHAGVYNLMGQFASDVTFDRVINYDGSPWSGRYEQINRWSPAFFAQNFSTPMLIIHGEKDYRVVVTQGIELYGVLTGKGVPARLVYYPNENHWILQPQNSIYWNKEVRDWFARWLK